MDKCKSNIWVIDGFSLVFQVVFIFAFLTIFFFVYVVNVEKNQFEDQMNYVVDNIMTKDIEKEIIDPVNNIPETQLVALISGIIDGTEFQENQDAISGVKSVNTQNALVRTTAFKTLAIVVGILILISISMLIFGYCLPVRNQTIEALWVVLFVAITEFVFLNLIASRYKSADPNKVKKAIGLAVTKWIKDNKKL
jgi:hypothetical protein